MSRRVIRRTSGRPRTPRAQILATIPYSYIRADSYTVDGGTSDVASFVDCVSAGTGIRAITADHALTAVAPYQCPIPAASPAFGGRLVSTFLSAKYAATSPASAWNFLHDGTGCTVYVVASVTDVIGVKYILSTTSTTGPGHALAASSDRWENVLYAAGGAVIANIPASTVVASAATVLRMSYLEGAGEVNMRVGTGTAGSGDTSGAPSSADAQIPLQLGCLLTVYEPWVGKFACLIVYNRVVGVAEDASIRAALAREYGA